MPRTKKATQEAGKKSVKRDNISLDQFLDEIKITAYSLYEERMRKGIQGNDFDDWLKAEEIIKKKYKI